MNNQLTNNKNPHPVDQLSFEQAYAELDEITRFLESDSHTLDQAVALFERGQALIQHCTKLLGEAELKVQQVIGEETSDFFVE